MKNEFRQEVSEKKKPARKRSGDSRVGKAIRSILDGSILTRENAVRLVPFILFLTAICIIYIANTYYADWNVRQASDIRKELKDLENEYLSTKTEVMMCNQQSDMVLILDSVNVKESVAPPEKIFIKNQ